MPVVAATVDERVHAEALKTLLNDAVAPWSAMDDDEVPGGNRTTGTLPRLFVLLSIERRVNSSLRATATTGRSGWRITTQYIGTNVDECRWLKLRTTLVLNEARLSIGGATSGPVQFEPGDAPKFSDGAYAGHDFWTYSL